MTRGVSNFDQFASLPSLSVAAHELKTPLALMRQLSLMALDDSFSEEQKKSSLNQLELVSRRSIRLVDDLTQAANLQASLFPLEPINPLAICRLLALEVAPMAKLYGHKVDWPNTKSKSLVVANRKLLERVLANFVDNAFKYSELGSPIKVQVSKVGDCARIGVRDHGPRLTGKDYKRLVDELETIKTLRTRPESSGLGVFLASEFAKAMFGKIGIIRHRDGVTFYVDLPLSNQMSLV